jgi:uncharacterized protein (DUF885 family)
MTTIPRLGALTAAVLIACAPAGILHAAATNAAGPKSASAANPDSVRLKRLADEYYDAVARFDPVSASENGDNRYADQIGMAIEPGHRAQQFARYHAYLNRLHALRRDALSAREQTSYDILDYELATALRFEAFPEHLLPLTQMDALPVMLANYSSGQGAQPLATVKDYQAYLNRLDQLAPWIDQAIANMRAGMRLGVVQPKAIMQSALPFYFFLVA